MDKIFSLTNLIIYLLLIRINKIIVKQRKNPFLIPIIIINFNQLEYLKQQINFYINRGFKNIIIIDNNSTYKPLLEYYSSIKNIVKIEFVDKNEGHMVLFKNKTLLEKYGKGYYVVTDADIVPNNALPSDFMTIMIKLMDKYFRAINKVGFALKIDDIPDYYPLKKNVLNWEKQFWSVELEKNVFKAAVDTTFALYKPKYPNFFDNKKFVDGIRIGGNFSAMHGGWYIDKFNMSEENKYYFQHTNASASWKFTEKGELTDDLKNIY